MEHPINIQHLCAEHAPTPDPLYAEMPAAFFPGKFVKLGFLVPEGMGPTHEHMWVEVTGIGENKELRGTLANEPVYIDDVSFEDIIEFDRDEIEALLGND